MAWALGLLCSITLGPQGERSGAAFKGRVATRMKTVPLAIFAVSQKVSLSIDISL